MSEDNRLLTRQRYLHRFWTAFLKAPASPGTAFPQADKWLSFALKGERSIGSTDRRWYSDAFFALVRLAPTVALAAEAGDVDRESLRTLSLALSDDPVKFKNALQKISPDNFTSVVAANPFSAGIEAALWNAGIPLWLAPAFERRAQISNWNAETLLSFIQGQSVRPPLWVRLQHPQKRAEVEVELTAAGFTWDILEDSLAWQLHGARGLYTLDAYKLGHLEIQDLASQRIGTAVQVQRKQVIWDCCAGGGGKTLQLAALLENTGAVVASDVRAYKLEEVKQRARRAGLHNIRTLAWDGETLPEMPKEAQLRGGYDRVLVDAPCSASGTWRRNPDAKLRLSPHSLKELAQLQLQILQRVAQTVRPEGLLIYATCSWLEEENEQVLEKFLQSHPTFVKQEIKNLGWPLENSDAMFVSVCKRVAL